MKYKIPFNKVYKTGKEISFVQEAIEQGKLAGNGVFTQKCQQFFEKRYGFSKCLLTTSCTDALEMAALLIGIQEGDEVIMPSYTFVSTANAFIMRGARVVFTDSHAHHPGMNEKAIESLITPKTKAIVVVHYAGIACDMDEIMRLSEKHQCYVVEDAAHAIDSYYINQNGQQIVLGSIGHLATFSFHASKNIVAGEGGMLVVNDTSFIDRAEVIWEKGTNRKAFFEGEAEKYEWLDVGSSFLPSELIAAFLYGQIMSIDQIQQKRIDIWAFYLDNLKEWALNNAIQLPFIPSFATNNAHMFYMVCQSNTQRTTIINALNEKGVLAVFHYLSLHDSPYFKQKERTYNLPQSKKYEERLVRLPLFFELTENELRLIVNTLLAIKF